MFLPAEDTFPKLKNCLFLGFMFEITKSKSLNSACHLDFATSMHRFSYWLQIGQFEFLSSL